MSCKCKTPCKKSQYSAQYNHYFKDVKHLDKIDVYRVLELFDVKDPCIQHAVKKLLVAGSRGVKDNHKDVSEAIDSLNRYQEMEKEDSSKIFNFGICGVDTINITESNDIKNHPHDFNIDNGYDVNMYDVLTLNTPTTPDILNLKWKVSDLSDYDNMTNTIKITEPDKITFNSKFSEPLKMNDYEKSKFQSYNFDNTYLNNTWKL